MGRQPAPRAAAAPQRARRRLPSAGSGAQPQMDAGAPRLARWARIPAAGARLPRARTTATVLCFGVAALGQGRCAPRAPPSAPVPPTPSLQVPVGGVWRGVRRGGARWGSYRESSATVAGRPFPGSALRAPRRRPAPADVARGDPHRPMRSVWPRRRGWAHSRVQGGVTGGARAHTSGAACSSLRGCRGACAAAARAPPSRKWCA